MAETTRSKKAAEPKFRLTIKHPSKDLLEAFGISVTDKQGQDAIKLLHDLAAKHVKRVMNLVSDETTKVDVYLAKDLMIKEFLETMGPLSPAELYYWGLVTGHVLQDVQAGMKELAEEMSDNSADESDDDLDDQDRFEIASVEEGA